MRRRPILPFFAILTCAAAQDEPPAALVARLGSQDGRVRHEAAVALAELGRAPPAAVAVLQDSLRSDGWYVRWQACLALGAAGPAAARAVPALVDCLAPERDVAREAALALVKVAPGDPEAARALQAHLHAHERDRSAVLHAIRALGPRGRPAWPIVVQELMREEGRSHEAALAALRSTGCPLVALELVRESPSAHARDWATEEIRAIETGALAEAPLDEVRAVLRSAPEPLVRAAACDILGRRGSAARGEIPALVPLLADPEAGVQVAARRAVHGIGGAPLLKAIVFFEPAPGERRGRAAVLLPFRGEELLPFLRDPEVGPATLSALEGLDVRGATEANLAHVMRKGAAADRACAALLLGHLAVDRELAKRLLDAALTDGSEEVRAIAKASRERLGDE